MKLFFDMMIVDEYGRLHARKRVEISREAAYIGERVVDDMKCMASLGVVSTEAVIKMMTVREFRKKLLTAAAAQSGAAMAEHLEDREGWHGLDRQEHIEAQYNSDIAERISKRRKPTIELADGVKRQGDTIFVPDGHKKWQGFRRGQNFMRTTGGFRVALKDLDNSQRGALGLPRIGEPE